MGCSGLMLFVKQGVGPTEWMYINILLERSELLIPLPEVSTPQSSARGCTRGLTLEWNQLRLGYFWGGEGECMLRVNAHNMSATASHPGCTVCKQSDTQHPHHFIMPFKAVMDVYWQTPPAGYVLGSVPELSTLLLV